MAYAPQFDESYSYNPDLEQFGPPPTPPPGYGERGGNYLLPDENNPEPNYLPQNPDGSTSFPQKFGPEPPTFYATNVPETAKKWGAAGQNYTFLAESPRAMETAKEIGAPEVMRGYKDEDFQASPFGPSGVGPEPKSGELDRFQAQKGAWKAHVDEHYQGKDPMLINPGEAGKKAREDQRRKEAVDFINGNPTTNDYKMAEKRVEEAGKEAEKAAEWQLKSAQEDHKGFQHYFDQNFTALQTQLKENFAAEQAAKKQKELDSLTNVAKAQKYTMDEMQGQRAPWNYELPPDVLKEVVKDPTLPLEGYRLKPAVLKNINRERERAGLPLIVEKQLPDQKEYTDWGLFKTGEKTTKRYGYEEGEPPARRSAGPTGGAPQVVRTGTKNGRRVVQYSDGRTEYAR
jgi:hypothetical protein